jgi:hypothetical protein
MIGRMLGNSYVAMPDDYVKRKANTQCPDEREAVNGTKNATISRHNDNIPPYKKSLSAY